MRLGVTKRRSTRGGLVDGDRVALAVGARRIPAHAGNLGLRGRDRAAQLLHLLDRGLDRVDEVVVPRLVAGRLPALAETAAQVTGPGGVEVVPREVTHLTELPAEDAAVEALRPLLVVIRDLNVVVLAVSHSGPPARDLGTLYRRSALDGIDIEPGEQRLRGGQPTGLARMGSPVQLFEDRRAAVAVGGVRIRITELGEHPRSRCRQ